MAATAELGGPAEEHPPKATVRVLDLVRRAARTGKRGKIVLQTSAVWETMGGVPELLRQLNKVVDSVAVAPGEWLAWSTTLLLTFKQVLQTLRKEDSDLPCSEGHDVRLIDGARIVRREGQTPRGAFVTCGGIPIVRNALDNLYTAHEAVVASAAPDVFPVPGVDHILTLMEIGVEILREITGGSDTVSDYVSSDPHLPWFLFWLITKRGYRPVIASILEEVLSCSPTVYDLKNVDFMEELVGKMSHADLTRFCRVLAAVVFDRDEVSECSAALEEVKAVLAMGGDGGIAPKPPTVLVRNQAALNAVPHLGTRLVRLLEANEAVALDLMQSPEFVSMLVHMVQNPDHGPSGGGDGGEGGDGGGGGQGNLAAVTLTELAAQIFTEEPGRRAGEPRADRPGGFNARQISQSLYKTEVLFVLCWLVSGVGKDSVKRELVEAGLSGTLRRLIDLVDWEKSGPTISLHGPDCNCVPESGLKVQCLRFVRHLCDVSGKTGDEPSVKRYMHSAAELDELASLGEAHGIDAEVAGIDREHCVPVEEGIISRIARLYSTVSDDDLLSYLANSLEGYLRGAPEIDRHFLERRGVLKRTVELMSGQALDNASEILEQSLFDLLGEMIRFSPTMLQHLDELLAADPTILAVVTKAVTKNLISSNVFLRSLGLTLATSFKDIAPPSEGIAALVLDKESKHKLVLRLIMVLTVPSLKQESLCCVSTFLCYFIFADQDGELAALLEAITTRQVVEPEGADNSQPPPSGREVLSNFRSLLKFWRAYYTSESRGKDILSLEANSRIPFRTWLGLVEKLLAPSAENCPEAHTIQFWEHKADAEAEPSSV